ncbi:methylamine utilization protein [Pontibacter sp. JAM-7]|uniref:methylamine utilization protein n=1 Tax=Pontibacter sp. JAM-7 TaxID=3366581 RepID=UPI003AF52883
MKSLSTLMSPKRNWMCCPLVWALLFAHAPAGFGASVQLNDSDGQPLADAVVIVPGLAKVAVDTPAIMDQVDKSFAPHVMSIAKRQLVSFPNSDDIRHHVYSFSQAKPFEIKLYSGVPSQPVLFDQAGLVVLGCNIHDQMRGYILVTDNEWSAVTDANGRLTLPAAAPSQVMVWHPRQTGEINQLHGVSLNHDTGLLVFPVAIEPEVPRQANSFKNRFKHHHD